jgi:hypothetical protein
MSMRTGVLLLTARLRLRLKLDLVYVGGGNPVIKLCMGTAGYDGVFLPDGINKRTKGEEKPRQGCTKI